MSSSRRAARVASRGAGATSGWRAQARKKSAPWATACSHPDLLVVPAQVLLGEIPPSHPLDPLGVGVARVGEDGQDQRCEGACLDLGVRETPDHRGPQPAALGCGELALDDRVSHVREGALVPDPRVRGGEVDDEPIEVRVADHAEMLANARAIRANSVGSPTDAGAPTARNEPDMFGSLRPRARFGPTVSDMFGSLRPRAFGRARSSRIRGSAEASSTTSRSR